MNRPSWHNYFLGLAKCVAQRSPDSQTKHGAIIANDRHQVLGIGFNGFPHGMRDEELPNTRPEKYPWMIHSEPNAIANCLVRPEGATIYVTGPPCNACLVRIWEAGIRRVIYINGHSTHDMSALDAEFRQTFLDHCGDGLSLHGVNPNLDWLKDVVG